MIASRTFIGAEPVEERIALPDDAPLRRELAAFLDHVAGGPPPRSDGAEGVRVVETVERLLALAGRP